MLKYNEFSQSPELYRSFLNIRIENRENKQSNGSLIRGQDPLGDLMDDLKNQKEDALNQAVELKRLGLIQLFFNVHPNEIVLT